MTTQNGFTLLEVLVALVVLSGGLLGMAALHIDGVRTGYSALQRTQAVNLAADMVDRIRANPQGDYNVGSGAAGNEPIKRCADNNLVEVPGNCSPAEMVAYDVWQWRSALNPITTDDTTNPTGLPMGAGRIDRDDTTDPDSMVVTVSWEDKGERRSYRLTVQQ